VSIERSEPLTTEVARGSDNKFEYIRESLNENEIEHFNDFKKYFQEIILKLTSNWDISKEAFYHGLSLGMLSYLDNDYYVTSNFEAGFGTRTKK